MASIYQNTALLIFGYMNLVFLIALLKRDNGIVDVFWGLGFTTIAWYWQLNAPHPLSWLTTALVTAWGIRLAVYIGIRNARSGKEDWRYAAWREQWGKWVHLRAYFQVFLLQGFFMFIIALPIIQRPGGSELAWYQYLGIVVWLVGFLWESIADWQLYM